MIKKLEWETAKRKVDDLIPYDKNPRKLTEEKREFLKKSLKKFGLAEIPAINKDNTILAGHQRMKVMQLLGKGEEFIDVRLPNRKLTRKEIKEYNITSNISAGEWDIELLESDFVGDIDLEGLGLDIPDFNFGKPQLTDEELNEVPELPKEPITVLGDLHELNGHRVLCGDSTNTEQITKLMNGEQAELYLTDPPYGVNYADKNRYLNAICPANRIQIPIENDYKTPEQMYKFWIQIFSNAHNALKNVSAYYIFSPQGGELPLLLQAVRDSGFQLKHVLVWVKNHHVLGRADYNYKHEPIVYGWKQKGTHNFYRKGNQKTSVWEHPKPLKNDLHPTMKPIAILINAILNSSDVGNIILDQFLGSGSTLIACEETNRKCYGMEIDPHYCDVIVNRFIYYMNKSEKQFTIKKNGKELTPADIDKLQNNQ